MTFTPDPERPVVPLPGGSVQVIDAAAKFGELLRATGRFYRRGKMLVSLDRDGAKVALETVRPASLPSTFETVARVSKINSKGNIVAATCSEAQAKLILHADAFTGALPLINVVTRCPVLIERDGKLIQVTAYDEASGVLAGGVGVPDVSLGEAVERLNGLLVDFKFTTGGDRSRALAAFITPALIHGDLLGGRAPIDLGEANSSQAGKGYRNKLIAAIYHDRVKTIVQRSRGVGSIMESFDAALVAGATFIVFDNIRGKIDAPGLESFLTEDEYGTRTPYSKVVSVDPKAVSVGMTSNRAEVTVDLANRASIVRIVKQPDGYQFKEFDGRDILAHVRANSGRYLGAVFTVVKAWHAAGKPRSQERRHAFRAWVGTLDWICQNIFDAGPLVDGHAAATKRMTNPGLTWLRDVALAAERMSMLDEELQAHQIIDLLRGQGGPVPGVAVGADLDNEAVAGAAKLAMGRKLAGCFASKDEVRVDGFTVQRVEIMVEERCKRSYVFAKTAFSTPCAIPPMDAHSLSKQITSNLPLPPQEDVDSEKVYARIGGIGGAIKNADSTACEGTHTHF